MAFCRISVMCNVYIFLAAASFAFAATVASFAFAATVASFAFAAAVAGFAFAAAVAGFAFAAAVAGFAFAAAVAGFAFAAATTVPSGGVRGVRSVVRRFCFISLYRLSHLRFTSPVKGAALLHTVMII